MDWGTQRRLKILVTIGGIIFILLTVFIYFKFFNNPPSCFDRKMNQDERGVDCGGICSLLCPDESRPPIVVFNRLFKIGYGVYSAVALVENPNQNVFSREVDYVFRVYDERNILLFEIPGTTFAPPGRIFPVFEHQILTGNREASKITFEIKNSNILWERGVFVDPKLVVTNVSNKIVDKRARIEADITNKEAYPVKDIPVIVVVYNNEGNAEESSATIVDYISPNDTAHVSFVWNNAFNFDVSKIDIIPRLKPRNWSH